MKKYSSEQLQFIRSCIDNGFTISQAIELLSSDEKLVSDVVALDGEGVFEGLNGSQTSDNSLLQKDIQSRLKAVEELLKGIKKKI